MFKNKLWQMDIINDSIIDIDRIIVMSKTK